MKDLSPRWAALTLLTPVIVILALVVFAELDRARAAKVKAATGTVVVGFTGSVVQVDANDNPIPNPPPLPYQHIYLNVISVRLNPSTSSTVSDNQGGWVAIPVPAGVGNSTTSGLVETGLSFGGGLGFTSGSVTLAAGRSELQIDATQLPQLPILFNAYPVRANSYNQVEIALDNSSFKVTVPNSVNGKNQQTASNAGNVVPLCGALGTQPGGEGCVYYPVTIFDPSSPIGVPNSPVAVGRQGLTPLIINIQVDVQSQPTISGAPVIIQPKISLVQNGGVSQSGQPLNQNLALITGSVSTLAGNNKTIVTAEEAGTNIVVEQYNVQNTGDTAGQYTLYLPAAAGGTAYDLYVSGPGINYAVESGLTVQPGSQQSINFTTQSQSTATLSGTIKDACTTTSPVQAARLDLLLPDPNVSSADCSASPPVGCVVVATTNTDEAGSYPLPVNGNTPAAFSIVPTGQNYTMLINAAGFDHVASSVTSSGNNFNCTNGNGNTCDFLLSHGYLGGTLQLASASNSPLSAMVMAEDTGTNNIEDFSQVIIPPSQATADFSMLVPDNAASSFDLFATVQDDFEGQPQLQSMHTPQQNTGHSIAVEADVAAPGACATVTASNPLGSPNGITCVGHGSLEGALDNPTDATSVVLEEPDPNNSDLVQIVNATIGPFGTDGSGGYAMCAPPETDYSIQRFDNGVAGAVTAVGPMNTPTEVPTQSPNATFTATPCPGICDAGQGGYCLTCIETGGPSL